MRRATGWLAAALVMLLAPGGAAAVSITSGPQLNVAPHQVTIWWTTDVSASTEVHWGPMSQAAPQAYANHSVSAGLAGALHSRTLSNLAPGTYYFRAQSTDAAAASAASPELSFTVAPLTDPNVPLDSLVFDLGVSTLYPVGDIMYVGGSFTGVWPRKGQGLIVDAGTGALWPDQPQVVGQVRAAVPDGAGGFYVGGALVAAGGLRRNGLVHILPDGGVDPVWNPDVNGTVYALALHGSTLYVGGSFTLIQGAARQSFAALDAASGSPTPVAANVTGTVYALAVSADGATIYLGGAFSAVKGSARANAAAIDAAGTLLGWAPAPNAQVNAIALGSGGVYLGGKFTDVNAGTARRYAASFDSVTGVASGFVPEPNNEVLGIAVSGSAVYLAGTFSALAGGTPVRNSLAAVDPTSGALRAWNPRSGGARVLAVSGNTVYFGGMFSYVEGISVLRNRAAAVDDVNGTALPWDPNVSGEVDAIAVSGSAVYLGGRFASAGPYTKRQSAAAIDLTTGALTNWDPGVNSNVTCFAESNGTMYLGGYFTTVKGTARSRIAAVDLADASLEPWSPTLDNWPTDLEVSGSTVYAAGVFTVANGVARNGAAAFDATSGGLAAWDPGLNGAAWGLAVTGSAVYVGGNFTSVNGGTVARNRAAAFDLALGTALPFNPDVNGTVLHLLPSGGRLFLVGNFFFVGGAPRTLAAEVDASSGAVTPWNASITGASGYAGRLIGSEVCVGGGLTAASGSPRSAAACFDVTTGQPRPWNPGADGTVYAIAPDCARGRLLAGGTFSNAGGVAQAGLATFPDGVKCPGVDQAPAIVDRQGGDDLWRAANLARYDVDFTDDLGLASFEVQIWAGPGQTGLLRQDWTTVAALSGTASTADWALPASSWAAMAEGINYVTVRVADGGGQQASLADAFSVKKDTLAPSGGAVLDGAGAVDADLQAARDTIAASWSAFTDSGSGVVGYEWGVGTAPGADDVLAFANVGLATSASASVALADGGTYFVTVRATDAAGNRGSASSNGLAIDATAPQAGSVQDGAAGDVDFQLASDSLAGTWSGFSDAGSGIVRYEWAAGTSPGATDVFGFRAAGLATSASAAGLSLAAQATYYLAVRAVDAAGNLSAVAVSDGVTVDVAAPQAGVVADGTSGDVDFQRSTSDASASWSGFSDVASGLARYEVALGTTPGGEEVLGFADVGLDTSALFGGLSLADGVRYFATVRASDAVGSSVVASSDGVTVDATAPRAGVVSDGSGPDADFQASSTALAAGWSGFTDSGSGVARYEWAAGTSAGASDVLPFTDAGAATSASRAGLALSEGTAYFVTVRAIDGVGNAATASSNGVRVDATPPRAGAVALGAPFQSSTTSLAASWTGFADDLSGIARYEWALGTSAGASDVLGFTSVGTATSASAGGLSLTDGATYFATVRAADGVGLTASASSPGVTVDAAAPAAGLVSDGEGSADLDFQPSADLVAARWSGFADSGSGLARFEWAAGTSPGGRDLFGFEDVALAASASRTGLALLSGTVVYVTVRATDAVGNAASGTSDGVLIDATPPAAGAVADGDGQDLDWQASAGTIAANWSGFSDAESGVVEYAWAVGTSPGAQDVLAFASVGTSTGARRGGPMLQRGATYYVTVRATNAAGLSSEASSDGMTIDDTPPMAGHVGDGLSVDAEEQQSLTMLGASWSGFEDPESPIVGYEWAIGTIPGAADVLPFTPVGMARDALVDGLDLEGGRKYYVSVRATNGAGLSTKATSNGVKVWPRPAFDVQTSCSSAGAGPAALSGLLVYLALVVGAARRRAARSR